MVHFVSEDGGGVESFGEGDGGCECGILFDGGVVCEGDVEGGISLLETCFVEEVGDLGAGVDAI